jgi:flavin reductase (DIM6/NTAB) family NADH-FMN oxidoreductase RutF
MFAADVTKGNDIPFRESKGFIVNLTDDEETLKTFAFSPVEERFKLVEYREVEGMPLLSKAYAYVVGARREVLEIGDHAIIVGEVKFGERMRDPTPLVYYMRDFRRLC